MTAVNINALGTVDRVSQPVNAGSAKETSVKSDFANVMKGKAAERGMVTDRTNLDEAVKQPAKRTEVKNEVSPKARNLQKQKDTKPLKKDSDIPETANEILAGAAEILNVTPEELKAALEALEMNVGDLADSNNVAQLILSLNGAADISEMLVDNGMLETFNELNAFVTETLEQNAIDPQDFKTFIDENPGLIDEKAAVGRNEELAEDEDEGVKVEVNEEDGSEAVAGTGKEPEFEVVNTSKSGENGTAAESEKPSESSKTDVRDTKPVSGVENFIRNLEMAVDETGEVTETETNIREIVFQVVQRIRVQISPESQSLEMRLNPENLGRVAINITSKAGVLTADIAAENRQAKEAIESSLQILKETFEEKGIRVEAIEVRVSDFNLTDSRNSESNANENGAEESRGSGRRGRIFGTAGPENEETDVEETILDPASTVSYRA